jgi:predicted metal-dependent phosphoesterase TrpH
LWVEEAIPPRLTAERTIELIHDQGGLAVAAHPLHPLQYNARGYPPRATLIHDMPLDAIEVVNNSGVSCRLYDACTSAAPSPASPGTTRARYDARS